MTDNTIYITKEGLEALKAELKELIDVKRPEVAQKIKEAREMGDISENAAWDVARQEQAFIEGRISELEEIIKTSVISDNSTQSAAKKGQVYVGATVTVHIDGENEVFHIVGAPEADPMQKKISHESPLGSSLVGKKVGDKIEVEAPIGTLTYTVLNIE